MRHPVCNQGSPNLVWVGVKSRRPGVVHQQAFPRTIFVSYFIWPCCRFLSFFIFFFCYPFYPLFLYSFLPSFFFLLMSSSPIAHSLRHLVFCRYACETNLNARNSVRILTGTHWSSVGRTNYSIQPIGAHPANAYPHYLQPFPLPWYSVEKLPSRKYLLSRNSATQRSALHVSHIGFDCY